MEQKTLGDYTNEFYTQLKKCYKCKEHKELTEFHKNRCNKDGYEHLCKKCKREWQQSHMTEELKEKNREKSKKYRETNREAVYAKNREYRYKHVKN